VKQACDNIHLPVVFNCLGVLFIATLWLAWEVKCLISHHKGLVSLQNGSPVEHSSMTRRLVMLWGYGAMAAVAIHVCLSRVSQQVLFPSGKGNVWK